MHINWLKVLCPCSFRSLFSRDLVYFKIGSFSNHSDLPIHLYFITQNRTKHVTENELQKLSDEIYDAFDDALDEMENSSTYINYLDTIKVTPLYLTIFRTMTK